MLPEEFDKIAFEREYNFFYDYLENMEKFLEIEIQKHLENLDEIIQKRKKLDETVSSANSGKLPVEMEYDFSKLNRLSGFESILRKSFFISVYTFLESRLIQRCRYLEESGSDRLLSFSEIAGEGINKAMTYLTKVQRIDFSLGTSSEWSEIQHYNRLRNCIVHNQGRLNDGYRKEQLIKLADYINSSESGLTIFGDQIIFDKEFCRKALKTVKNFLIQVLSAKTNVR